VAAARLTHARAALKHRAEELNLPVENLLTPDYVRRLLWEPPAAADSPDLPDLVANRLRELGARRWQVDLTRDLLVAAIIAGEQDGQPAQDETAQVTE
jgi:ribonuclease D